MATFQTIKFSIAGADVEALEAKQEGEESLNLTAKRLLLAAIGSGPSSDLEERLGELERRLDHPFPALAQFSERLDKVEGALSALLSESQPQPRRRTKPAKED